MDPLSALSIAAAVVQFVQFGCSLVSKAQQFYDSTSGNLTENIECESATTRIIELTRGIQSSASKVTFGPEETAIEAVCQNCIDISKELLARLQKLRLQPGTKGRRWKSFRQSLMTIWLKEDMEVIEKRLLTCQRELDSHLIANTWKQVSAMKLTDSQVWASLDVGNQQVIDALLRSRDLLAENLSKQTQLLIQLDRVEHLETRATILKVAENKTAEALKIQLLQSLKFMAMDERHNEICDAHHQTFQWIFQDPVLNGKPWSNFVDWLQQGRGIYWINGKAGSGKSTLMRYIVKNPKTQESIKIWSNGNKTKVVSFFFWNSGTSLQRSQISLFRSLLYNALEDHISLVPYVFPEELLRFEADFHRGKSIRLMKVQWSLSQLQGAFTRLTNFRSTSLRLCFFIDGLDEYEGDHECLADFFKTLSFTSHIKLCVSSRPWLVFEESFKDTLTLRLQDLTFDDIIRYVHDKLRDHQKMLELAKKDQTRTLALVNEIVTKADGVFLWVTLVVRSLLNGLRNGDDISDLRRRVEAFPAGLGPFYTHMMDQIEPLYRKQASQIFQIFQTMTAVQGEHAYIDPLELNLALTACPTDDLQRNWDPMQREEIQLRRDQMDVYLKSRCSGLLEISEWRFCSGDKVEGNAQKVGYLHRTVKDFLESDDVRAVLLLDTAPISGFEPSVWVLTSYITRLRRSVFTTLSDTVEDVSKTPGINNKNVRGAGNLALRYAVEAEEAGNTTYAALLDALDKAVRHCWQGHDFHWQNESHLMGSELVSQWTKRLNPQLWHNSLLTKAVSLGLCSYVEMVSRRDKKIVSSKSGRPLLDFCVIPNNLDGNIPAKMVGLLVDYGADVNQNWEGFTTWEVVLYWVHSHAWSRNGIFTLTSWAHILKLLLQHGADPFACCAKLTPNHRLKHKSHLAEDIITDIFADKLPHEADELRFILQERKKVHEQSRTSETPLKHNSNWSDKKRRFSDHEESESRKRRPHPESLCFNNLRSSRHRYVYS